MSEPLTRPAKVEESVSPSASGKSKPQKKHPQECKADNPVRGAAAASEACDDALNECAHQVPDEQIKKTMFLAAASIKESMQKDKPKRKRPSGKLKSWGELFEICTSSESNLGKAAEEYDNVKVFRVTKECDFGNDDIVKELKQQIKSRPGCSLHGSLPCTPWSTWQEMAIHRYGSKYKRKLDRRRQESVKMLNSFIECAEIALSQGGEVSFEWPRYCLGWLRPELIDFITRNDLFSIFVDGCATGMTNKEGVPVLKQWRFVTSSQRQAVSLAGLRCQH